MKRLPRRHWAVGKLSGVTKTSTLKIFVWAVRRSLLRHLDLATKDPRINSLVCGTVPLTFECVWYTIRR